ncbi:MAG TPA: hypothetical protein VFS00_14720, partial [Polyangiaceae bacterium]|nr:hypothetical protein [Polyangiaceae bacterium]
HIYHSEIGLPGMIFPDADIIDFAGLMHADVARGGFDVEGRCAKDRPEAIFLPHPGYVALRRRVEASECLRGYQRVVRKASCPLYVRSDLADAFRRCAREAKDPWVLPPAAGAPKGQPAEAPALEAPSPEANPAAEP